MTQKRCAMKSSSRLATALFVVLIALSSSEPPVAKADGMMAARVELGQSTNIIASPKQEAFVTRDADKIQVVLRTHFRAGPKHLAWIVPVPQKPEAVEEADDEVFEKLEAATAPTFTYFESSGGFKFGCGASDPTTVIGTAAVSVIETGKAGIFDYAVLEARETGALTAWLEQHEYAIPEGSVPVFQRYVDDGWYWLAIRLDAKHANEPTLAPHPIRYTYHDSRLVYPLVISSLSADELNEIVLYVLGDQQYGCQNWSNLQLEENQLALDDSSPSGTNYEKLFLKMIEEQEGHAFIVEFAHDLDKSGGLRTLLRTITGVDQLPGFHEQRQPCYLTRLRAVVSSSAMDRDVVLVPHQVTKYNFVLKDHTIYAPREGNSFRRFAATVTMLGALLLGYMAFRRRRKRQR